MTPFKYANSTIKWYLKSAFVSKFGCEQNGTSYTATTLV